MEGGGEALRNWAREKGVGVRELICASSIPNTKLQQKVTLTLPRLFRGIQGKELNTTVL